VDCSVVGSLGTVTVVVASGSAGMTVSVSNAGGAVDRVVLLGGAFISGLFVLVLPVD
jgi:hypothetical protein